MYTGFLIYVTTIALITLLVCSKTCRKVVVGAIIFAILLGVVVLPLHGAMADETRRVEVINFDFEKEEVLFEDEDGFIWRCPFGKFDWAIGEEYKLYLPDIGEPEIREAAIRQSPFFIFMRIPERVC